MVTRRTTWVLSFCIFVVTLVAYPNRWNSSQHLSRVGIESLQLGRSLALQGTFSNPFATLPTGPSAHTAPGYPGIVAAVIKVYGTGAEASSALQWITRVVLASQLALLPFLAEYFGLVPIAGAIAAAAWLVAQFPLLLWENDFAGLLIVVLAFPMYKSFRAALSPAEIAYTGALWAVLLLLTPTPVFVLAAWLLALLFVGPQSKSAAVMLGFITVLLISPWLVRNYRVFHQPVFMRDNLGLELAVSNNPCAEFSMARNLERDGCFSRNHPNESLAEALRVADMGEANYNKARLHEAAQWIGQNRSRFWLLTAERSTAFWYSNDASGLPFMSEVRRQQWILNAFTLLSIPGMLLLWKRERYAAVVVGMWLLFFPPIYYLLQYDPRYRHPIFWATLLPGAYALTAITSAATEKWSPNREASNALSSEKLPSK